MVAKWCDRVSPNFELCFLLLWLCLFEAGKGVWFGFVLLSLDKGFNAGLNHGAMRCMDGERLQIEST